MKLIRTFSDTTKHTVKSVVDVINDPNVCAYQSFALFMGKRDSSLYFGDQPITHSLLQKADPRFSSSFVSALISQCFDFSVL